MYCKHSSNELRSARSLRNLLKSFARFLGLASSKLAEKTILSPFSDLPQKPLHSTNLLGNRSRVLFLWCNRCCYSNKQQPSKISGFAELHIQVKGTQGIIWHVRHHSTTSTWVLATGFCLPSNEYRGMPIEDSSARA